LVINNLSGQVVFDRMVLQSGPVALPQLAPGLYVYRLGDTSDKLVIKP
jgi:hypothetical protein